MAGEGLSGTVDSPCFITIPSWVLCPRGNPGWYPLENIQKAIEHGHRNSEFSHQKWWFSIATLNYQRVSTRVKKNPGWAFILSKMGFLSDGTLLQPSSIRRKGSMKGSSLTWHHSSTQHDRLIHCCSVHTTWPEILTIIHQPLMYSTNSNTVAWPTTCCRLDPGSWLIAIQNLSIFLNTSSC